MKMEKVREGYQLMLGKTEERIEIEQFLNIKLHHIRYICRRGKKGRLSWVKSEVEFMSLPPRGSVAGERPVYLFSPLQKPF